MEQIDLDAIAARVRGLLGAQDQDALSATASRIGVDENSLRLSIARHDPRPSASVLLAIIEYYGVDPSWLMTGTYDLAAHRLAAESDSSQTRALLERSLAGRVNMASDARPAVTENQAARE